MISFVFFTSQIKLFKYWLRSSCHYSIPKISLDVLATKWYRSSSQLIDLYDDNLIAEKKIFLSECLIIDVPSPSIDLTCSMYFLMYYLLPSGTRKWILRKRGSCSDEVIQLNQYSFMKCARVWKTSYEFWLYDYGHLALMIRIMSWRSCPGKRNNWSMNR